MQHALNYPRSMRQLSQSLKAIVNNISAVKWVQVHPLCLHYINKVRQDFAIVLGDQTEQLSSRLRSLRHIGHNSTYTPCDESTLSLEVLCYLCCCLSSKLQHDVKQL